MNNTINSQFGDTTLTKVFVGGLAWETPEEALRDHFEKYGDILEAVIISDKLTARSKGYGFVTFRDAESASKACEDPSPVINGRRSNCNLASLGARRSRSAPTSPPPPPPPPLQQGSNVVSTRSLSPAPPNHVHWYYPPPASTFQHRALPFYGYAPPSYNYIAASDMSYNHNPKVSYTGGSYMNMNGHFSHHQVYPGHHAIVGANTLMPMYHLYNYHHQSHTMGLPAQFFPQPTGGPIPTMPTIISKPPPSMSPNTVCLTVE